MSRKIAGRSFRGSMGQRNEWLRRQLLTVRTDVRAAALIVMGILILSSCSGAPTNDPAGAHEQSGEAPSDSVPEVIQSALTDIQNLYSDDGNFASFAYDKTVRSLAVFWYGTPPEELIAILDRTRADGFSANIVATQYRMSDLRTAAEALTAEYPGEIAGAGARGEGDGITVSTKDGSDAATALAKLQEELSAIGCDFPIYDQHGALLCMPG